ncbi:MAG: hypothetical protein ACRDRS_15860 [Pseudonocardiaceae bacterium]
MAIELPSWLTWTLDVFGFYWPGLNEDHFNDAATYLRQYAKDAAGSIDSTHRRVADVRQVYDSGSYEALLNEWGSQTRSHMQTLVEGCHYLADGLDIAAEGIVAMKAKVIVQLGIAAAEFAADQAAAVATAGIAEAALPVLIAATNRLINGLLTQLEQEVLGHFVEKVLGPVQAEVERAVAKLTYQQSAGALLGPEGTGGIKADTEHMRVHAEAIHREGEGASSGGARLAGKLSGLSFATGG